MMFWGFKLVTYKWKDSMKSQIRRVDCCIIRDICLRNTFQQGSSLEWKEFNGSKMNKKSADCIATLKIYFWELTK